MTARPTNLESVASSLADAWSPKVVARVNDQYVKVARLEGEFVWHAHEHEDEAFLVLRGGLRIQFEEGAVDPRDGRPLETVTLGSGDLFVVPKGVRHNPVAEDECWIALIEPVATRHTGDVVTERTRSVDEQLG